MSEAAEALERELIEAFLLELPQQAAEVLTRQSSPGARGLLEAVQPGTAALALRHLNADAGARIVAQMEPARAAALIELIDPVRAAGLLARLRDTERQRLLALLPPAVAQDIEQVLQFPHETAGWRMDPIVTTFPETASVGQTLDQIRQVSGRRITDVIIASPDNDFVGVVPLQSLVGARPEQPLSTLVQRGAPNVPPMSRDTDVVEVMNTHRLASVPVVGVDGKVLGIIRHDGLVGAAQQVMGDNMQQMVGAAAEERALSTPWFSVKSRLPWLQINLLTAFLASAVVGFFDATIAQFTALAVLMPVVAGQSGNTGAQALAVTARGLALREIRVSHVWRVLAKELVAALINGSAVAIVTSIGVLLWSKSPGLAFVIGTSMVASMVMAAVAGGAIPIILTALKRDPATASSIILTTVTDICGFFSFLGLATLLSGWLAAG